MIDRKGGLVGRVGDRRPSALTVHQLLGTLGKYLKPSQGQAPVASRTDPAVFMARRRIIEQALRIVLADRRMGVLSLDQKKPLASRMAKTVWCGYLLGLAHEELSGAKTAPEPLVDMAYLWQVFETVWARHDAAHKAGETPEGAAVTEALSEIREGQIQRLADELGGDAPDAAARAVPWPSLERCLDGLALRGYLLRTAQREALGR